MSLVLIEKIQADVLVLHLRCFGVKITKCSKSFCVEAAAVSLTSLPSCSESSDESGLANTSTRTQLPQSMKIMHEIMYKLEVLYVLCVLLMGRQRNQVSPWQRSHMHKWCRRMRPGWRVPSLWGSVWMYLVAAGALVFFQVHKMIAEFKLIPGLNNLFDKLIWRKHSASALVLHGHNQNCDCSPVSNLFSSEFLSYCIILRSCIE